MYSMMSNILALCVPDRQVESLQGAPDSISQHCNSV